MCVAPFDDYSKKLKGFGAEFINIEYDNSNLNPLKDLLFLFKLTSFFKKHHPDIILSYTIKANIYGGLAAQFAKISFIANISGLGSLFIKKNIISKFSLLLYKISLRKADKLFFQNQYDYSLFLEKQIIKKQHAEVIPGSGIDLVKFSSNILAKRRAKFIFLFASRLLKDKGIIEAVEATNKLKQINKNVELQVLGKVWTKNPSSIKTHELNNWINSGLISYLGFTDDVRPYIENADVVILPSYREGMSRILLEASSMGKPIITTDVPGCRDVVDDIQTGFLCKARDSDDLAEKMLQIIEISNEERALMGKRGREKMVNEFDEKIVIYKYLEIINKLIA
ncbi:MAG: glycosyltransferase family 4 protein [Chlorobi bacterium]|nr:glycosyltransferase family 4 protein [Chlorobiota bacterium]